MFDQLSDRLQSAFSTLSGKSHLNQDNMDTALREVRRGLLEADVSLKVIKAFLSRIKDRAEGESVLKQVEPGEQLIKIVHDELVKLLGSENKGLNQTQNPSIIMLFGLQGSGKTTTCGKLALSLKKDGLKPLLIAADVYRPAAIDQLITLAKGIDVPVSTQPGSTDVLRIVKAGLEEAKQQGCNIVIIDTAGRLQLDTDMMAELLLLERSFTPHEKLLVIDAMTGQEAVSVAEMFNSQLDITGIVMSKMDGDARGGSALSVVEVTGKPIKFIATGEKLTALEKFYPDRMATRILGMGDVVSLVEKAQEAFDMEETMKMEDKIRKQEFSLEDFMKLMKSFKMLGSLDQILGMLPIPGLTKEIRGMVSQVSGDHLKKIEVIINSMTPAERKKPSIIQESRKKRIAKGCGLPEKEIGQFLVQFAQMSTVMKQFTKMKDSVSDDKETGSAAKRGGLTIPRRPGKKKKAFPSDLFPGGKTPKMPPGMKLPPGFPGSDLF